MQQHYPTTIDGKNNYKNQSFINSSAVTTSIVNPRCKKFEMQLYFYVM